jgi:serine phosphatase RsbU (regulator of sigma subunit)/anti-sigma regulatory factor (Ser/Thr protein kinase)
MDQTSDLQFIADVSVVLSASLDRARVVDGFAERCIQGYAELCAVFLLGSESALTLAAMEPEKNEAQHQACVRMLAYRNGPVQEAMRSGQPLLFLIGHAANSAWSDDALRFLRSTGCRSMIIAPLVIGTTSIGALCFAEASNSKPFDAEDVTVAEVLARQLAIALENISSHERERRITERFKFLAHATDQLFATHEELPMLRLLVDAIVEEIADLCFSVLIDGAWLRVAALAASNDRAQLELTQVIGKTPFNRASEANFLDVLRVRRSVIMEEVRPIELRDIWRPSVAQVMEGLGIRSWMMVPLSAADEIRGGIVCCSSRHRYDRGDLELLQEIGRRASLALEHAESFARERRLARTLQQATLPSQLAQIPNASLSAVYLPAAIEEQVGGDWYDIFNIDDGRVLVTIGDVTGHGLQASVIMGKLRHALNVVAMYESDPVRIIDVAEQVVLRRYPGAIATAFIAIVDLQKNTITYANAGHPLPFARMRDGSIEALTAVGLPIGLRSLGKSGAAVRQSLADIALLLFYTDGLTEAEHDPIEGERRLHEIAASDIVLYVSDTAKLISEGCLPERAPDDVAVLALNFVPARRWSFASDDASAAQAARREYVALLQGRSSPVAKVELAAAEAIFGELVANISRHAAGMAEVALEWRKERAVLHVIDYGAGLESVPVENPTVFAESGRGLWLVRHLAESMEIEVVRGIGTHICVGLPVASVSLQRV